MTVADCTAGGGGHGWAILDRIGPEGFLVAMDQDPEALQATKAHFTSQMLALPQGASLSTAYTLVHSCFSHIKKVLKDLDIASLDGALMDLGVSSFQLDDGDRGFSYQHDGILDMRMNAKGEGLSALDVVNGFSAQELEQILWQYGEERWSRRIAQFIVEERKTAPIRTTEQLVRVIKKAIPAGAREDGPHPAKRSFQAIRIFVNRELAILEQALEDAIEMLAPMGKLAVITFHSGEDRLVKDTMKRLAAGCVCPKDLPLCVCGRVPKGKILTSKPITPTAEEVRENPRARSAKLRGFQKSRIEV